MKLGSTKRPLTKRERLMSEYVEWHQQGRPTVPTPRILAGMYAILYKKRYRLLPISPVQSDIEDFDAMLSILSEDKSLAPYCLEVLFAMPEFNVKAQAFANQNVLDKWGVVERAHKLRKRNGGGEQAEFKSDVKTYGVIRV
jgi:hypothetical protein